MARYVEWVGQRSILADPRVEFMLATGRLSERETVILREASKKRIRRMIDRSWRLLEAKTEGLSQSYKWGPSRASMIQVVTDGDAAMILNCSSKEEFREVDSSGQPLHPLIIPDQHIVIARKEEFADNEAFQSAMRA